MLKFFPFILMLCITISGEGQKNPLVKVPGYRELLSTRFEDENIWNENLESNLTSLLSLTIDKKNKISLLVPLETTDENGNVIVSFCYSDLLRKELKRGKISYVTDLDLSDLEYMRFDQSELSLGREFDYDSIYQHMRDEIFINTNIFDLDQYFNSDLKGFCSSAKNVTERFGLIYTFFRNGILLSIESYTGNLYYVPY